MNNKLLILKIADDKLCYNDTDFIAIEQTNFPKGHMAFKSHLDICWLVEMKGFNKENGRLFLTL
jgi:hypothetical protein